MSSCSLIAGFMLVAFMAAHPVAAQENRGTILGRTTDSSGLNVEGASVSIRDLDTGLNVSTVTNADGLYRAPSLPPGRYEVSASKPGFKRAAAQVSLSIQQNLRQDFVMQVGDVKESISVTGEAAPLVTDTAALGNLVQRKNVTELPISGRNLMALTLLGPGVSTSINGVSNTVATYTAGGVALSSNGMRSSANQYSVDGANVNSGFYNVPSFVPVVDAVEEFRVQTGNYSAEYGGFGGAHVNYSLRSGTNQFRGSVWEFLRNDALDARNAFTTNKPPMRQNQFGGILSGPITRDRLFFMGSYEGLRLRRQSLGQGTVPTESQRNGNLELNTVGQVERTFIDPLTGTAFPGNIVPPSRLSRTAQRVLRYFPLPNQPGVINFRSQTSIPTDNDSYLAKVDYHLSNANRLAARYASLSADLPGGTIALFGDFGTRNPLLSQNVSILDTHTLSPSTLLDFRLSWNRMLLRELGPRSNSDFDPRGELAMAIPSVAGPGTLENGFPRFNITGFAPVGDSAVVPLKEPDDNYQLAASVSTLRGKHGLKFGVDYRRARSARIHGRNTNGTLQFVPNNPAGTGNALADFLLGLPQSTSIVDRSVVVDMRQNRTHFFLADNWNLHPRLTLELGVRYELNLPVSERYGRIPVFDFTPPGEFRLLKPGEALFNGDYNNLAPRLGLAWRVTPATVIRAAYGVFYSEPKRHGLNVRGINPPFVVSQNFVASREQPLSASNPFPLGLASAGGVPAPNSYQVNARTPYLNSWSLNVQRSILGTWVAEAGYVGNRGVKFGRQVQLNVPLVPGPGNIQARRPLPAFGMAQHFQYDATSDYHGLQTRLEKRFNAGYSVQASYTFSRAIDLSADELAGGSPDPRNQNRDRGLSDTHVGHRFTGSWVWEIPLGAGRRYLARGGKADVILGGWQLSGIATAETGVPLTISAPGDTANIGLGSRPNRLCDGRLPNGSANEWFDTSCFVMPGAFSIGNSGRGILAGPGAHSWNIGVGKRFRIVETHGIQFRAELFNAWNRVNLSTPGTQVGTPAYGRILASGAARNIQLGLKYGF
ncbi:MAG: TonB-dependent receptor domain-containing protein [Acidobacteriota bacterium]|jgi:hypothetical protein